MSALTKTAPNQVRDEQGTLYTRQADRAWKRCRTSGTIRPQITEDFVLDDALIDALEACRESVPMRADDAYELAALLDKCGITPDEFQSRCVAAYGFEPACLDHQQARAEIAALSRLLAGIGAAEVEAASLLRAEREGRSYLAARYRIAWDVERERRHRQMAAALDIPIEYVRDESAADRAILRDRSADQAERLGNLYRGEREQR